MTCESHTLRQVIALAWRSGLGVLVLCVLLAPPTSANSRLEDIADFAGGRDDLQVGYGLVVGLDGTGASLRNSAFTAESPNGHLSRPAARVSDPATVALEVPSSYPGQIAALLTEIEQWRLQPDQPARIVIDERSGVIVTGATVRISPVAVAQGNLSVRVTETPQVSQPDPLAEDDTVVVPRTRVEVEEDGARMVGVEAGVSLQDLVAGLNALGVGPRDLIGILQAIKAAGALQAEIVVM